MDATTRIPLSFRTVSGDPAGAVQNNDFVMVVFEFADGQRSTYLVQLNSRS